MNKHSHRKDEHVFISEKLYHSKSYNQLDEVYPIADNLPELSLDEIDISTYLAGKKITTPFFINAMTGGSNETKKINQALAIVARKTNLAMAVGSQSILLKSKNFSDSFSIVRKNHPNGVIIANLGATAPILDSMELIDLIKADILQIHINVAQELVMPEGDRHFYWLDNIKNFISKVNIPIIIKEVGFGMTPIALKKLSNIGVRNIDLGGSGGTSFVAIENQRRKYKELAYLDNLSLSLAKVLIGSKTFSSDFSFTASGGIKTALDIAKCLVLGADNVGISSLFLHILLKDGQEVLVSFINQLKDELKKIMLLLGARDIPALKNIPYTLSSELLCFSEQIKKLDE